MRAVLPNSLERIVDHHKSAEEVSLASTSLGIGAVRGMETEIEELDLVEGCHKERCR